MNYQELIAKITKGILDNITPYLHDALKRDKTFKAKVTEVVKDGKIKVLYCGKTYTVSTTVSCKVNDIVRVCVPSGNWQDLFVVENRTKQKIDNSSDLDNETIVNMINELSNDLENYLPLSGGKATGNLTIEKASPTIWLNNTTLGTQLGMQMYNNTFALHNRNVNGDNSYKRILSFQNSAGSEDVKYALQLGNTVNGTNATYNIYGEHNKTFIRDYLYPVGSVVCMSTNTNPSTKYGGTWELIDKEYKNQQVAPTVTLTNASTATVRANLSGHEINFYITYNPSVELTDSAIALFKIDPASCGATQFTNGSRYYTAFSDNINAVVSYSITTEGTVSSQDVMVRGSSTASVAAGTLVTAFNSITVKQISLSYMLDSFCDKFYFKRTA